MILLKMMRTYVNILKLPISTGYVLNPASAGDKSTG